MSAILDKKTVKRLQEFSESADGQTYMEMEHALKNGMQEVLWLHSQFDTSGFEKENVFLMISRDISSYKKAEVELRQRKKRQANFLECSNFDLIEFEYESKKIFRISSHNFLSDRIEEGIQFPECFAGEDGIHPDYIKKLLRCTEKLSSQEKKVCCEILLKARNGEYKWALASLNLSEDDSYRYVICILEDITAEKEAAFSYLNETMFYQAMLSSTEAVGHIDVTEDKIIKLEGLWNLFAERIMMMSFSQLFSGFINKLVHKDDREQYSEIIQVKNFKTSYHNGIKHLEYEFRRVVELNKFEWMNITAELFESPINGHLMALMYIRNIDQQKKQKLILERESGRDALTGLFNKKTSIALMKECLRTADADEINALILMDLNDFRSINENYGYKEGDDILIRVSAVLSRTFRKYDIIGRFGGDEFIIFIREMDCDSYNLQIRLDSILDSLKTEKSFPIEARMGVVYSRKGIDFESNLEKAKRALDEAKSQKQSLYIFYNDAKGVPNALFADENGLCKDISQEYESEIFQDNRVFEESTAFDSLVGACGDMAYLINPKTYGLICGNQAFYDRVGMTEMECCDMRCYEVLYKRERPCPFCGKVNWSADKFYLFRNYNEVLEQEYLIKNKLVRWMGKEVVLAVAVNLSSNRNILDSMENEATENNCILTGIQHMQNADNLDGMIENALETIGSFYRADSVQFWCRKKRKNQYTCTYNWKSERCRKNGIGELEAEETVTEWLTTRKWEMQFIAGSQEMMLLHCYALYEEMKKHKIVNQQWQLFQNEKEQEWGYIVINNRTVNYQNVSFLNTFVGFMVNEWTKRSLMMKIIYDSTHDRTTGAYNRLRYEQYLLDFKESLAGSVGVVAANIDRLKAINEVKGFQTGNQYLCELVQLLQEEFGQEEVFRLSGDDFIVVVKDIEQQTLEAGIRKVTVALKKDYNFTASMGYAWDNLEMDISSLVEYATRGMRKNKRKYYDATKDEKNKERTDVLKDLLKSIEENKVAVFLQPKIDIRTGKTVGAEALIRYFHEEHKTVPPGEFIQMLETYDLIRYIDLFVFEQVCGLIKRWIAEGRDCPRVSLNFSRLTLAEDDLVLTMEDIFSRYQIPKELLEIEITESYADIGKARLNQAALSIHQAGYRISLDDFGTKFTNLTILSDIIVDVLKIDRSLIHSVVSDYKNRMILKNVIQMCKDLNIEVIAEGVETKEQEEIIRELGCYQIQGFLYGRPTGVSDFEEKFLKEKKSSVCKKTED